MSGKQLPPVPPSRRDFLALSLAVAATAARADDRTGTEADVHQRLLQLAGRQEARRRARFAAVRSKNELEQLQQSLRQAFLDLLDGLPSRHEPASARKIASIEADDYVIEKLILSSLPGYLVPALLYRPRKVDGRLPGVLSPCGHSTIGKAEPTYQILHVNLAKRGYVVLTYDPVGQGERSQFWDATKHRSRFNLSCGEHAVLGNPLYLLGTSLARYRIWDGMRALDYLASRPEVDATRLGCAGNSGGGTLTAYLTALDPRIAAAAVCCYITTLPRRMGNRIQTDPSADPEQDIFNFVGAGIDHAGLLALMAPRPVLLGTARFDFFPIEGARESFEEARRLYTVVGVPERIERVEAKEHHGLTLPLREAAYGWFDRWLCDRKDDLRTRELPFKPRPASALQVCPDGQVNLGFHSTPLLPLALNEFKKRKKAPSRTLKDLLRLDPESAAFRLTEVSAGTPASSSLILCVNGVEATDWRHETRLIQTLASRGHVVMVVDPRGVGKLRVALEVGGHDYADPLDGVEENVAYNAFLVGKSLLGMRVTDVLAVVEQLMRRTKPKRLILCARRDAGLVACLAAAVEPRIDGIAVEEMLPSFWPLFEAEGHPVNAASILPNLLRDYGDLPKVLESIAPRSVLLAAPTGKGTPRSQEITSTERRFSHEPQLLLDWLG
jgi:dienelactone hydrolase